MVRDRRTDLRLIDHAVMVLIFLLNCLELVITPTRPSLLNLIRITLHFSRRFL